MRFRGRIRPAWLFPLVVCAATAVAIVCPAQGAQTVTTNLLLAGTRFATEVYFVQSGNPGPTVFICGGMHGNEPAGAVAAERMQHWPLARGNLVIVPRANMPALRAFRRHTPGLSSDVSNLNRNYPRAGRDEPPRGEQAQAIWRLVQETRPDWVLDLHEGHDFHLVNKKSVGSSIIPFTNQPALAAADIMVAAVNRTIPDTDEKARFARLGLPIDGSLARASGEHLKVPAMIIETTFKLPLATRVRHHETAVYALLEHLGMMEGPPPVVGIRECETNFLGAPLRESPHIRVALYCGPGDAGQEAAKALERAITIPGAVISQVSPDEIRCGCLTNFDVAIFGGGAGRSLGEALGEEGRAAVRKFVGNGGGYVGICAGAYLATSGFPWSLGLLNAITISPQWQGGEGTVKLELTPAGAQILGQRQSVVECRYINSPIIKPGNVQDLPPYETLAVFRSELAENGTPPGVFLDSPAIVAGRFMQGRVVCISPHPEQTAALVDLVPKAVEWTVMKGESL